MRKERRLPGSETAAGRWQTGNFNGNYIEYAKVPGIEQHSGHFVALYQFLEETYGLIIDATRDRIQPNLQIS